MSRRLLFLAYYYAPHHSVAAIRATAMARHLADLGWRVTVLTVDGAELAEHDATLRAEPSSPARLEVIRTAHRLRFLYPAALRTRNSGLSRIAGGALRLLARRFAIEREIGWRVPAQQALGRLSGQRFDVVLSCGSPWLSHALAAGFARVTNTPYVLDYRDLWSGHQYTLLAPPLGCGRLWERRLRWGAAATTIVSPSWLAVQRDLFGEHPHASVISNGYEEPAAVVPAALGENEFTMLYAGQFYPPDRTITPFLRAYSELRRRNPDKPLQLHHVGPSTAHVKEALAAEKSTAGVLCEGRVPRERALKLLNEAGVVLISASNQRIANPAIAGMITGKIFEVLAYRKPYLVIAPENSDLYSVVRTAGGGRIFTSDNIAGMADYLEAVMAGHPPPYVDPAAFSWETLARQMDGVLTLAATRAGR